MLIKMKTQIYAAPAVKGLKAVKENVHFMSLHGSPKVLESYKCIMYEIIPRPDLMHRVTVFIELI